MKKLFKYGCLTIFVLIVGFIGLLIYSINKSFGEVYNSKKDAVVEFRTNSDLTRVSGIKFPEVVVCDSLYHTDFNEWYNKTAYTLKDNKNLRELRNRAKKACVSDSAYWTMYDDKIVYRINADIDIDRSVQQHGRLVEFGGEMVEDWQGRYICIEIPVHNDTITVSVGSAR